MSICTVPQNQPIYQALLDKAASYPASATQKSYQAKAYNKAAEGVLTYYANIYNETAKYNSFYGLGPTNVGPKIETFIYEFTNKNPETKPVETPKPVWSYTNYLESLKPVVYTTENPRRSARIAAKAPAPKPVTKPAAKPSLVSEVPLWMRDPIKDKKVITAVPLIRTYGAEDEYENNGFALYRVKDKFEIICVDHCSCFDTVEVLEGHDEDEYDQTLDDIIHLATAKSDPRVPDVVTEDPYLLSLYESILAHKDVLETWNPEELDEHLDMICVLDPEWKHKA